MIDVNSEHSISIEEFVNSISHIHAESMQYTVGSIKFSYIDNGPIDPNIDTDGN